MQSVSTVKPQVKSNKLQFMGVGNCSQHKVYVDVHPMKVMLEESFWVSLVRGASGDRLFPGDTLTIREVEWADMSRDMIKKVICRADCEVLSTGKRGAIIAALNVYSFERVTEDAVDANDSKNAEQKGLERKWDPVKREHNVLKDGAVVHTTKDKAEADGMVEGHIDIPPVEEHEPRR